MSDDCVFCRIVARQTPADIAFEDDEVLAFKDIYPKAPVHLLIIPKRHIESIARLAPGDTGIVGRWHPDAASSVSNRVRGARVSAWSCNVGPEGGQVVYHLHFHLTAGRRG